jgi:hypothetical protein
MDKEKIIQIEKLLALVVFLGLITSLKFVHIQQNTLIKNEFDETNIRIILNYKIY